MAFTHGVYTQELPTPVYAMREVDSALPFVVGTAPVHNLSADKSAPLNEPKLLFNFKQFVETFGGVGDSENEADFTLSEFARIFFTLYNMGPVVFVNVLDPANHTTSVTDETKTFEDDEISAPGLISGTVTVTSSDGSTTYEEGTDYEVDPVKNKIVRLEDGTITSGEEVQLSYDKIDPSAVVAEDIVGGVDSSTGDRTGLEIIENVFPEFGKIVGLVLAPGYSYESTVATAMISKAELINEHFRAMAYIDIDPTNTTSSDAVTFKQDYSSPHAVFFWPKAKASEDKEEWLSSHAAGLTAKVDFNNGGVPFESPSNKTLRVVGPAVTMPLQECNYLNEQGITTLMRMFSGWKLWGNRTSAFPGNTDIKDSFIPTRRMANFIENNLIVNTWQKVDNPMNTRLIESVTDTTNIYLNGYVGRDMLLGARVGFLKEENPDTDLSNGIIRIHIWYLAPPPAETIEFLLEVDTSYFSNLFE